MKIDPCFTVDEPYDVEQTASEVLASFGVRLKLARIAAGYKSGKDLADVLEVDQNTYKPWERGRSYPNASVLITIRQKLSVTIDWLYAGDARHLTVEVFQRIQAAAGVVSS